MIGKKILKALKAIIKRTISKALKGAIRHWKNNVAGKENSWSGKNCELCVLSRGNTCYIGNERCPVFKKTGIRQCEGTPWGKIRDHVRDTHPDNIRKREFLPGCPECDRLKREELEFLKSLLPKRKKRK